MPFGTSSLVKVHDTPKTQHYNDNSTSYSSSSSSIQIQIDEAKTYNNKTK